MSSPNVEGSNNPASTGGASAGVKIGLKTSETLGFYGATGVVQPTSASVTDYASLKVALQALGLIGS